VWHRKQSLLDAEIENSTLQKTLEALASATGWIIYVEPDTEFTVSSKFKNRSVADALARLFGSLNYAILPQKNGSSKLFVFRSSLSEATVEIKSSNAASKGANNEDRILNEWVVVMKKGSKTSIDDLAKKYGAKVGSTLLARGEGVKPWLGWRSSSIELGCVELQPGPTAHGSIENRPHP
jgi:hypothetical protein